MSSKPGASKVYDAVGECIYCGASEGKLSDEHIIPFGLGGTWVLPKASCGPCATVTSGVELFCQRPMLGPFRIRLGLPTRRRKDRPDRLPIELIRTDGKMEREEVAAGEFPFACIGFRWPAPGILRGALPMSDFEGELVVRQIEEETRRYAEPSGQRVKLGTINMLTFSRMLAKIAHAYAVAEVGLRGFRPLLNDLILGRSDVAPPLVGGASTEGVLQDLHRASLMTASVAGADYLVAGLQLFAFLGMPEYLVVVGERK